MNRAWAGPMVAGLIVVGVVAILATNLQPGRTSMGTPATPIVPKDDPAPASPTPTGPNAREYPIGEPVIKNHVQVAAVWLAGVSMEGMTASPDVIHLEADVKATEDNPNGFAKDEFVSYLKVAYSLVDAQGGAPIESGEMSPMVASDGLHYGASVSMPKPGTYKLLYRIQPPSAGGLGRHVGLGGVAPWWEPFEVSFDWTVEATPATALAGSR